MLCGLFSSLPRTLEIENQDWHRLTVDDINDIPPLTQLMNCLEFCNGVAQVVHPLVQEKLLEFLYRGFLVPVVGPALLQVKFDFSYKNIFFKQSQMVRDLKVFFQKLRIMNDAKILLLFLIKIKKKTFSFN